ncbi:MAG: lysylphosphatidylglycerol synthase transmembrane domain-containing protein, partial [Alphaproteobacteria bacterium]|nr:lysylphosphatidylglycerol synthase transmembrane domain-containing protein [Alphaproteobacteria bacterium]
MRHLGRPLLAIFGLSAGALCLWLAMRGVDWREAGRIFRAADVRPIAAGVALYGAAMLMRAGRWRGILSFRSPVGLGVTLKALLAGYAVNSILPARLGELFRADYMARQSGLSRSGVLASIFVERLLDLVVVVGMLALGLAIVGGGSHAVLEALAVGILVVAVAVAGLYLVGTYLSEGRAEAFVSALFGRLPGGQTIVRLLAPRLG